MDYHKAISARLGYMRNDPASYCLLTPGYCAGLEIHPKVLQVRQLITDETIGLMHVVGGRAKFQRRKNATPMTFAPVCEEKTWNAHDLERHSIVRFAFLNRIPKIRLSSVTQELWEESRQDLSWVDKTSSDGQLELSFKRINPYAGKSVFYFILEISPTKEGYDNLCKAQGALVGMAQVLREHAANKNSSTFRSAGR